MPPRITTSNLDLRAQLASEPRSPCFARPSTCFSLLRRIISLLWRNHLPVTVLFLVHRAPPILLKPLLLKRIFLQKPVRRPPILPVSCLLSGSIRENQDAKPLSNPGLILPSSLPSKLGWSPGDLRCVNAVAFEGGSTAAPAGFRCGFIKAIGGQESNQPGDLRVRKDARTPSPRT